MLIQKGKIMRLLGKNGWRRTLILSLLAILLAEYSDDSESSHVFAKCCRFIAALAYSSRRLANFKSEPSQGSTARTNWFSMSRRGAKVPEKKKKAPTPAARQTLEQRSLCP